MSRALGGCLATAYAMGSGEDVGGMECAVGIEVEMVGIENDLSQCYIREEEGMGSL